MLPAELIKFFKPKPEHEEDHDPMLITDPRQLANYIKELRRRKQLTKQQYRNIIIRLADRQHLDTNGMNVRQWIYEEETLPNEGDKEIPVKRLTNKADLKDKIRTKEPKCGDIVRIKPNMLHLLGTNEQYYTGNTGAVISHYMSGQEWRYEIKWQNKINTKDNVSALPESFVEIA